jgi:hypothetical protein
VIDISAISAANLRSSPYRWARVDRSFESIEAARELARSFPAEGFWSLRSTTDERSWSYAARPLVILGADEPAPLSPLPPPWLDLVEDLLSPGYRDSLSELTGLDLGGASMEASAWRWDAEAHLSPHRDLPEKLLTHVFYLEPEWDARWGGCLRILGSSDESDCVEELPPALGTASVVVRGEGSWHSVTPVRGSAPRPRRNVIVTWQVAGSPSPVWDLDARGRVACTAGGVREDAGVLERTSRALRGTIRRFSPSVPRSS